MAKNSTINDAQKLIKSAAMIAEQVGPLVAAFGPKTTEAVAEYGPKAAEAAVNAAKSIGLKAAKAGETFADTAVRIVDGAKLVITEREQEKILRKAREDTVKSSTFCVSVKGFKESYEATRLAGIASDGFMSLPGCYAIVLLSNSRTKDYAQYEEVYVGSGLSMGDSVYEQFMGNGNVDVYADVKYDQAVHVLLYPCDKAQMDEVKASLIFNFQAYGSYNARDVANS